jgi:ketosteroid isomerase-like protein
MQSTVGHLAAAKTHREKEIEVNPLALWLKVGVVAMLALFVGMEDRLPGSVSFRDYTKASAADDRNLVAALDAAYQAAVKKNDASTMDRILADDFTLVTGSGKTYTKADLLEEARTGRFVYEHQEDSAQMVRIWGDTAVVTAKLWEKGAQDGKPFDYTVWFSDTYVRTATGWRYVFGQSSLPLPKASQQIGKSC